MFELIVFLTLSLRFVLSIIVAEEVTSVDLKVDDASSIDLVAVMVLVNIVGRFSFGKESVPTGLYNADASDVAEMGVSVLVANVVNDGMMLVDARKSDKELALFQYIRLL